MSDEKAQESQQESQQDSGLQTPQPDQPHPPVRESVESDESPPVDVDVDVSVDNPAAPSDE